MKSTNLRGSRSGGPCPKQASAGSSSMSRRADSRLRGGSEVKARGGSCRPGMPVTRFMLFSTSPTDQRPVGLAPVGHLAGAVTGHVQDGEARHLVALAQGAIDLVRRPGHQAVVDPVDHRVGHPAQDVAVLHRRDVALRAPQRNPERLADAPARALVVGVGVRERVRAQWMAAKLAQDAPVRELRPGIDQNIVEHIDVDGIRRDSAELPHPVRERLHEPNLAQSQPTRLRSPAPRRAARTARSSVTASGGAVCCGAGSSRGTSGVSAIWPSGIR